MSDRLFGLSPKMIVTLVGCGLAVAVVVAKWDDIRSVELGGVGIKMSDTAGDDRAPSGPPQRTAVQGDNRTDDDVPARAPSRPTVGPAVSPYTLAASGALPIHTVDPQAQAYLGLLAQLAEYERQQRLQTEQAQRLMFQLMPMLQQQHIQQQIAAQQQGQLYLQHFLPNAPGDGRVAASTPRGDVPSPFPSTRRRQG